MATLGDLAARISGKLKDPDNTHVTDAQVKEAINDAISYWKKRGGFLWFTEFKEDVTLTVGNPAFSLTTNTALSVFDRGGMVITDNNIRYPLLKVSSERFDLENIQAPGRPYIWVYRNGGFECYFYPDQAYTLTVRGKKAYADFATDESDNGATNDWLTEAEKLIEHEALSRLHTEYKQDFANGEVFANSAKDEFKALKKLHREKVSTGRNELCTSLI